MATACRPSGRGKPTICVRICVESSSLAFDERSEEHTSELQSQSNLVCRLLLEKKKENKRTSHDAPPPPQLLRPRYSFLHPRHPRTPPVHGTARKSAASLPNDLTYLSS